MMTERPTDPRSSRARPWIELGVGVAVGYMLGRRRAPDKTLAKALGQATHGETILHSVVRSSVTALAAVIVKRVLEHLSGSEASGHAARDDMAS
ncbi:MAG: hypothetical protein NT062_16195 [Proteobacteria bacterium]|nr:hypothetical protein [Pseudomonadota bacterium]